MIFEALAPPKVLVALPLNPRKCLPALGYSSESGYNLDLSHTRALCIVSIHLSLNEKARFWSASGYFYFKTSVSHARQRRVYLSKGTLMAVLFTYQWVGWRDRDWSFVESSGNVCKLFVFVQTVSSCVGSPCAAKSRAGFRLVSEGTAPDLQVSWKEKKLHLFQRGMFICCCW